MHLKFAKMKVTAKLAVMNFDYKSFYEKIDESLNDRVLLYKLFSKLAEFLSIYFSVNEQIAIRNALFPQAREEPVMESRTREIVLGLDKVGLAPLNTASNAKSKSPSKDRELRKKMGQRTFHEVMVLTIPEFQVSIKEYMVTKWDFIKYVMNQWFDHMNNLSK